MKKWKEAEIVELNIEETAAMPDSFYAFEVVDGKDNDGDGWIGKPGSGTYIGSNSLS